MTETPRLPAWIGLVLAVSSAALVFASGEPLGLGTLAWVSLVPLFVAVWRAKRSAGAFAYGLVYGLVYFAVELWWIFIFGWMAWVALTITMALYIAVACLVSSWVRSRAFSPMLVAGAWVGAELLRDRWPYGSFSWGSVGTTQVTVPGVRWLAGVVGTYGLSLLVAVVCAVIARRIAVGEVHYASLALVGLVLAGFVWADLAVTGRAPDARTLDVTVVQGNVPRPVLPGQRDRIFRSHYDISTEVLADRPPALDHVVVWPEDSLGIGVSPSAFDQVTDLAGRTGIPFLVGRSIIENEQFLNRTEFIDSTGEHVASYQKRHPVPFGEYVPIPAFRRFVGTLEAEIPTDQTPGKEATVFDVDGTKIATPICFESVFPRDFLDFARQGAELYVLMTNDASFERSFAAEQHLAHTQMRALETRQWVVQAALSGISASIAPDGEITHRTDMFEATAFTTKVGLRRSHSLYAKTGDVFAFAFASLTALVTLWGVARRKRE